MDKEHTTKVVGKTPEPLLLKQKKTENINLSKSPLISSGKNLIAIEKKLSVPQTEDISNNNLMNKLIKTQSEFEKGKQSSKLQSTNSNLKLESKGNLESEFKLNGDNFKKFLDHFEKKATNNLTNKKINDTSLGLGIGGGGRQALKLNTGKDNLPQVIDCLLGNLNISSPKNVAVRPKSVKEDKLIIASAVIKPILASAEVVEEDRKLFQKNPDDYKMGKELGKGAYALVKKAVHKPTGTKVAIKIYEKFRLLDKHRKEALKREINIMKKLNNSNVVRLVEVIDQPKQIWLIMEFITGTSLLDFIKSREEKKISEKECKDIYMQLMNGINYLHSNNISHRDIKLDNIIIDDSNCIKIIDFGFSAISNEDKLFSFFCGTPSYMPPEIIKKQDYIGTSADIWTLGIVLYFLLCGTFPFRGLSEKELYDKILKGIFTIPETLSIEARNLIKKLLLQDPKCRPKSYDLMVDPWFYVC